MAFRTKSCRWHGLVRAVLVLGMLYRVSGMFSEPLTGPHKLVYKSNPYDFTRDIIVEREGELTVDAGVVLRFAKGKGIIVRGALIARGLADNRITFTRLQSQSQWNQPEDGALRWPDVRLVDGNTPMDGRLQIFYRRKWRSVCTNSKNWTETDLQVACRQLGFSGGRLYRWFDRSNDSSQFLYEHPNCTGSEQTLTDCSNWEDRQLGGGVCDYHLDIGITCDATLTSDSATYWRGIHFENARFTQTRSKATNTFSKESWSVLENVDIRYAGRDSDSNATSALQSVGVPPVLRGLEVRWSAYTAVNISQSTDKFSIEDSVIAENQGGGVYINSSAGMVNLLGLKVRDNGGDGIRYIFHDTFAYSKNEFCHRSNLGNNQIYPVMLTHEQSREQTVILPCIQSFEVADSYGQVLTVHFLTLSSDEGNPRKAGYIYVFDGQSESSRILASFPIMNSTRPQSVTSSRNAIRVMYRPPDDKKRVMFTLEVVTSSGKAYDLNAANCIVTGNNGRGMAIENQRSGTFVNGTMLTENTHVAGLHVVGGSGDVVVNNSVVSSNIGDGVNVSFSGGYVHVDRTTVANNSGRGVAVWFNETLSWAAFNFSTHVAFSRISNNGLQGLVLGNVCETDSFWNVSMNTFRGNSDSAVYFQTCHLEGRTFAQTTFYLNHNSFLGSRRLSLFLSPAFNITARVEHNVFSQHETGAMYIGNRGFDDFSDMPAAIHVAFNTFTGNRGVFVASVGLVQGSSTQELVFTRNQIENNTVTEMFPSLNPRSRVAAVVVVASSNVVVMRNYFNNPKSPYELGSHLEAHDAVINASLNYWGVSDVRKVYSRIFDRKDRYNLARVEFLRFITLPFDLTTTTAVSDYHERDKIIPFRDGDAKSIGGEVAGNIVISEGEYVVTRDIFVRPGSKLTVPPGVVLRFEQSIGMMVQGYLGAGRAVFTMNGGERASSLKGSSVRLSNVTEGRLEVRIGNRSGGICTYGWDITDAAVVCHQLGLVLHPQDWLLERSQFAHSSSGSNIVLNNVQCSHLDTDISQCRAETADDFENSCTTEVGMRCYVPSWAGIRFGMAADESTLKEVTVEKAGLLDYSTHVFQPAVQLDFNRHLLDSLEIRYNTDSGLGIMWNDIYYGDKRRITNSNIYGNQAHGIETRSQGFEVSSCRIRDNVGSGFQYNPMFSMQEQKDLISWINRRDKAHVITIPDSIVSDDTIILPENGRKYLVFRSQPGFQRTFSIRTYTPGKKIGIMVLNPFSPSSTEQFSISSVLLQGELVWDFRKNLTSFPLITIGSKVSARYFAGNAPDGAAVIFMSVVEGWKASESIPTIRIASSVISGCGRGISTHHYNRDVGSTGDHFNRYSNESIVVADNDITGNKEEAMHVWTPYWDPLVSSLAEVNYTLLNNRIRQNTRGIVQYNRDIRNSNNLFHWTLNNTDFRTNSGGGVNIRLPYVWQYSENYTHTVAVHNSTFQWNENFEFHVGGHFAKMQMSNNVFKNNFCKLGVVSISGMEKELLIEDNVLANNSGQFVVEFSLESHADKFGVVDANFRRNRLEHNRDDKEYAESRTYQPSSYTIGVRGIQEVNITRNLIFNPGMQFELLAGVLTGSLENTINVAENWWGFNNVSKIQSRIFDFDDWNGYAVADYSSYLALEDFDSPAIPSEVHEKPLDLNSPLGGRVYKDITLRARSSPYVVRSDLTIMPKVTLTIEPGVEMEFYPSVGILVLGDLSARGEKSKPITMRAAQMVANSTFRYRRDVAPSPVRLCVTEFCNDLRSDGFLEIYNTTTFQWVPVCESRFTERNAQVVCRQLGYGVHNVHVKRGLRMDLGPTRLSRIRSWPHPLECTGSETALEDCDFRLNGYMKEMYMCSYTDDFVYVFCGPDVLEEDEEHWGGVRFAIPDFEDSLDHSPHIRPHTERSELRHVKVIGAGILHGEPYTAVQSVYRKVALDEVSVTKSASHGVQMVAVTESLFFSNLVLKNNLGVGLSVLALTGETSNRADNGVSYQPLKHADLPYNVFGMVSMCDTNKEMEVRRRVLLYYKYDNKPVDCVKIFSSQQQVGLRLLQFNLFNGTAFSSQPDVLRIYDGDIFNSSTPLLGLVGVDMYTAGKPSNSMFYLSSGNTLSVQLHATGGGGAHGFIAEVVTFPVSYYLRRDLQHNITQSEFSDNQMEGVAYRSAGAITPQITFAYNRLAGNGRELFGNFTTADSAALFDIQNAPYFSLYNNMILQNQGGLRIQVDSPTFVASMEGFIVNNVFSENSNREALLIERKNLSSYQLLHVFRNYFTRNAAQFHETVSFSRIVSNFTANIARNNTGTHLLNVRGFEGVSTSLQTCSHNSFTDNVATDPFDRSTIVANNAGQSFKYNILVNPDNDFELSTVNRSMQDGRETVVDATRNWWGTNETSAISGRIKDSVDYPELLTVRFKPFQEDNSSLLSGKCAGGWEKLGDTCFLYLGGIVTFKEAKMFCEMDNSAMPYVKNNHGELMDFIQKQQKYFDWNRDKVWVQSINFLFSECTVLYKGSVRQHPCDDYLPFLCERDPEISVTARFWYQEMLTIISLVVTALAILMIGLCLGCWLKKSRHRYQEKLERKNSIRASIRSNHSLTGYGELGYKRRLEKAFKEDGPKVATLKLNGSVDSIEKVPSQFTCSLDDSHSYDATAEARNHNVEYSDFVNRFAQDARLENATANMIAHPTFDLTYENRGYIDRSLSRASPGESRDWSTATDSTLDMKRSLEGDSKDLTFQSTPSPRVSSRDSYPNNGCGSSSRSSTRRPPLETAM